LVEVDVKSTISLCSIHFELVFLLSNPTDIIVHHARETKEIDASNWVGDKKLLGKLAYPDQSSDSYLRFPNPSLSALHDAMWQTIY